MNTRAFSQFLITTLAIGFAASAFAQDYPYDDVELKKDESAPISTENPEDGAPSAKARPVTAGAKTARRRNPPLFRVGLKAGGNYTIFQQPNATDTSRTVRYAGLGFEGGIALGWDLPYQPIFIEFETGYRGLLMTAGEDIPALHVIPISVGLHYRSRMGRSALWKPGFRSSLDIRIAEDVNNPGSNTFGVFPSVSLVSLFEFDSILIEPIFTISRLQSQFNFVTFALRGGFRF